MKKYVLVTGSNGLVGSESVKFFCNLGFAVVGVDNDMRKTFFGSGASTLWNERVLKKSYPSSYIHTAFDIRNKKRIKELFQTYTFDLIIHAAAQPSHDWAAINPEMDFSINAMATLQLLEEYRAACPDAVFIFTSTNKVYGDRPNLLPLVEKKSRFELPKTHKFYRGIDETMSIDNSLHSLFGASKTAADILVQEYGRYFDLATGVFRCGCITGPAHSGTRLHGFLAYLVTSIATNIPYAIEGYKGKQVRDNIHAYDLVSAFYEFYKHPRKGEVYNMGGGRHSNTSILEAIVNIESQLGKKAKFTIKNTPRKGDHIWYISDVSKFEKHYPRWNYTYDGQKILEDLAQATVR